MYATNRLLGFESLSPSILGFQAVQGPVKPTPDIQNLIDAALKLPILEQKLALEKALDAALASKDNEGVRYAARSIKDWFPKSATPTESIQYFEALLKRASAVEDRNFVAVAAMILGESAASQGAKQRAIEVNAIALGTYRFLGDNNGVARLLVNSSEVKYDDGEYDTAKKLCSEALVLFRRTGDKAGIADSLTGLSVIHLTTGDVDKAYKLASEALALSRRIHDKRATAESMELISIIQYKRGDIDRSFATISESLKILRTLADKSGIAQCLEIVANFHAESGKLDKALEKFTEALAIYRELGEKPHILTCLFAIGYIHLDGNVDKALDMLLEAVRIARELMDRAMIAQSLVVSAKILTARGEYDTALPMLMEAFAVQKERGDKEGILVTLVAIATVHESRGDLDKAFNMFTESLTIAQGLGDELAVAMSREYVADIHVQRLEFEKALRMYSGSMATYRKLGKKELINDCLCGVATVHLFRGDPDQALRIYSTVLASPTSKLDLPGTAQILGVVANIHRLRGDLGKAYFMLSKSLAITRQLGISPGIASIRLSQSLLLDLLGRQDLAAAARSEAAKISNGLGNLALKATVLFHEGDSLLASGDHTGAMLSYSQAMQIWQELPSSLDVRRFLVKFRIGEALLASGNQLGIDFLSIAVDLARNYQSSDARALTVLGRAHIAAGKPVLATEPLQFAVMAAVKERNTEDLARAYAALAEQALAVNDREVAVVHLKRAVESRQSQRRSAVGLDDEFRMSLSTKVAPDYLKLVSLLTDAGRLGEAVEAAELLKRSEALTQGDLDALRQGASGTVSAAESAYRKAAEDLGKLGDRERFLAKVKSPSDAVKAEMTAMPGRLRAANQALSSALDRVVAEEKAAGSAAGRARDTGAAQARLSAALKGLGPGTAAVTVLCLPEGVRFLVSTASSLTLRKVDIPEKTLSAKVKAFRDLLLDPGSDPVPAARVLHDFLWAPLEPELRRLGVRQVLLSLTGSARYVPFGALHDGKGYVAERWELSLFSPTALERLSSRPSPRWSVLAAGCGLERTVDDGIGTKLRFAALLSVRSELSKVRSAVGSGPSPLVNEGFTLSSLKSGLAAKPKVVHLASHFRFDSRGESLSFLLTGKGDVLRVSDTSVLTKDAFQGVDLLSLSACQTGSFSDTADGMEMEGIASLLQRKGAAAVLSTLWPVADASTAAFMGTFYMLRAQDPRRTKAWCLREVQLRMIRGEVAPPGAPKPVATRDTTSIKVSTKGLRKDWSHPYHWAPFILQGNPL